MEVSCQLHAPAASFPGTHWIRGWAGPRAILDAVVKRRTPCPHLESNPRNMIVQPTAQWLDWIVLEHDRIQWQALSLAPSNFITGREFSDQLGYYHLLKKYSTQWSCLRKWIWNASNISDSFTYSPTFCYHDSTCSLPMPVIPKLCSSVPLGYVSDQYGFHELIMNKKTKPITC